LEGLERSIVVNNLLARLTTMAEEIRQQVNPAIPLYLSPAKARPTKGTAAGDSGTKDGDASEQETSDSEEDNSMEVDSRGGGQTHPPRQPRHRSTRVVNVEAHTRSPRSTKAAARAKTRVKIPAFRPIRGPISTKLTISYLSKCRTEFEGRLSVASKFAEKGTQVRDCTNFVFSAFLGGAAGRLRNIILASASFHDGDVSVVTAQKALELANNVALLEPMRKFYRELGNVLRLDSESMFDRDFVGYQKLYRCLALDRSYNRLISGLDEPTAETEEFLAANQIITEQGKGKATVIIDWLVGNLAMQGDTPNDNKATRRKILDTLSVARILVQLTDRYSYGILLVLPAHLYMYVCFFSHWAQANQSLL
jgi:hypothetical protein